MQVIYNIDSFVIMLDKDFANMKAVIQIALQVQPLCTTEHVYMDQD